MENYKLLYTKSATKEINRLDPVLKNRLRETLEELRDNPSKGSRKLVASKIGRYRARIGKYRLVFDIEGQNLIIVKFAHRSEVYKR